MPTESHGHIRRSLIRLGEEEPTMLRLADAWTWDFWLADDGQKYHLFFLKAPKSLGDPDQRHFHASVGHAVSLDLCNWDLLPDAIVPGKRSSFDDIAVWTGSVVNGLDGRWYMYYTGITTEESGLVQRIGLATSEDLIHWEKNSGFAVLSAGTIREFASCNVSKTTASAALTIQIAT